MNKIALVSLVVALSPAAFAAKTYQVTGNVTSVNDKTIVVEKGKEKFEISRDATTKVSGDPAVGSKATVYYSMAAAEIEVKGATKKK